MPKRRVVTAVLVSLAILALLLYAALAPGRESSATTGALVPSKLAGYPLIKLVAGKEAVRAVQGIHWNPGDIRVLNASIALYGEDDETAFRLWVALSPEACSLVERMASSMKRHEAMLPYTAPVRHDFSGLTVYFSLDKRDGRLHAFWCEGSYVIWLEALDRAKLENALAELIAFYRSR